MGKDRDRKHKTAHADSIVDITDEQTQRHFRETVERLLATPPKPRKSKKPRKVRG